MPDNKHNRIWECGSRYKYFPAKLAGDEDPWQPLLESLIKKENIRCNSWKDEVQNLLLFAGLFSTVVTVLLAQSYKLLQEDQDEKLVALVTKTALKFDMILDTDNMISSKATFSPPKSVVLINTLWFLSLVLSLSTVLFGTTSLQWLREHQHYGDRLTAQEAVAVFHMRAEALEKWMVPQIFSALPLLLQAALVLFLVGLIGFSLVISRSMVIPITLAVAVGLPILLGIATTVLPTIQVFWILDPRLQIKCLRESFEGLLPVDIPNGRRRSLTSILMKPSIEILANEVLIMFLSLPGMRLKTPRTLRPNALGVHYLELCTRMLGSLYAGEERQLLKRPGTNLGTKFFQQYYREIIDNNLGQVSPEHFNVFSRQILLILERFFLEINQHRLRSDDDVLRTYYSNQDLFGFLHLGSVMTWRASKDVGIETIFRAVSANLEHSARQSLSFPFSAAVIFMNYLMPFCALLQDDRVHPEASKLMRLLRADLEKYEEKVTRPKLGAFYSKLFLTKLETHQEEVPIHLQTRIIGFAFKLVNRLKAWKEPYDESLVPTEKDKEIYQRDFQRYCRPPPQAPLPRVNQGAQLDRSAGMPPFSYHSGAGKANASGIDIV
ncbi:hypothetical protein M413DRAFT_30484 [Hebeloma cylindrosporum]|uniref:DUF6535 domain-containing protein n=1 Tax=Hebeloma cylindrosporum TaxID=76867 RepID=A0A0C3C3A9_HEBCY|nr:hypothetical protein M413DRAFT_30484 [Hebeloma cylindrosporum h7]